MNVKALAKPWMSDIIPYEPGQTIPGAIKLASNENSWGPSPKAVKAIKDCAQGVFRYPYMDDCLIEAIGKYCGYKKENIVVGNGSDELIDLLIKSFKGSVASHYPTFLEYPAYSRLYGMRYISSALNDDFSFDADRFISQTKEANILFLCTPNNPTGTTISLEDIKKVADSQKLVVVDEAYHEFCGQTAARLVKKYPNIVILRTFAKAFGLAGLRLGYSISRPETASIIRRAKPPFNVNSMAHQAGLAALSDLEHMRETVSKIVADRSVMEKTLSNRFRTVPSSANFIMFDVSPITCDLFYQKMLKAGIILRKLPPIKGFAGNWMRITIGTTSECEQFVKVLWSLD